VPIYTGWGGVHCGSIAQDFYRVHSFPQRPSGFPQQLYYEPLIPLLKCSRSQRVHPIIPVLDVYQSNCDMPVDDKRVTQILVDAVTAPRISAADTEAVVPSPPQLNAKRRGAIPSNGRLRDNINSGEQKKVWDRVTKATYIYVWTLLRGYCRSVIRPTQLGHQAPMIDRTGRQNGSIKVST
jgi:hypothetical protein